MLTYLFDASSAIELYLPRPRSEEIQRAVRFILEQKTKYRQAVLYIPNFCVVEVFSVFARKYFRDSELSRKEYEQCLERFREDIHWGKILYVYDLNRYHIVGADEIIPIEHGLNRDYETDRLSSFDILVIAMACEQAYIGRPEETFVVTSDFRMKKVIDRLRVTDIRTRDDLKVPGPLDDRSVRRWLPPNAIYLRDLKPDDIREVPGQNPFNP
jgi:hypothetical protein